MADNPYLEEKMIPKMIKTFEREEQRKKYIDNFAPTEEDRPKREEQFRTAGEQLALNNKKKAEQQQRYQQD